MQTSEYFKLSSLRVDFSEIPYFKKMRKLFGHAFRPTLSGLENYKNKQSHKKHRSDKCPSK